MEQSLDDLAKLSELKEKGIITEEEFQQKKAQLLQLSSNQETQSQKPNENVEEKEKWYKKPFGIIALLILFFPVGLFLMWKYTDWHKNIKWGITGFFALIVIWSIVSSALAKTPVITLNDFEADKTVTGSEYSLSGKVDPPSSEVKINGKSVEVKEDGSFTYSLSLEEGVNEIKIEANNSGKTAELSRKLTRELTEEEKVAKAAEEKRKAEEEAKRKAEEEAKKAAEEAKKKAEQEALSKPHFGDGTHQVGKDIKPGTYRTRSGSSGCYYARLSGFGGDLDNIISNDNTSAPAVVTIAASDKGFESSGCGTWTQDLSQITSSKTSFGDGIFIVGTDLVAGTYRSTGASGCYYARLSGFGGDLNQIIANNNTDSAAIVTIAASDKGFQSSGCGTWTKQ